jgi:CRP-like cAMP-binding protein
MSPHVHHTCILQEKKAALRMEIFMRKFALVQSKDYTTSEDHQLYNKVPMPLYSSFSTKASKFLYGLVTRSSPVAIAQIREALTTPPSSRSVAMQSTIMNMLLRTRGFSEYLSACSINNLVQLAGASSFIHLSEAGVTLASEGDFFDCCFIVITGSVNVVKWKSKKYRKKQSGGAANEFKYNNNKRHSTTKVVKKGIFIGEDVFCGKHCWKTDIVTASEGTSLCLIPIQAIAKQIGMVNIKSQNFIECFWKHMQLWNYSKIVYEKEIVHHFGDGLSKKLEHIDSSHYFFQNHSGSDAVASQEDSASHDSSTANPSQEDIQSWLTRRAHIRCYRPGEIVFEQGTESHLLFVVMVGECAHVRKLQATPPPLSGNSVESQKDTSEERSASVEVGFYNIYR